MPGGDGFRVGVDERAELSAALSAYEIHGVLGRGAFGSVYAATHVRLGRDVAIKVLSGELLDDADARDRFATEARLLASLDHVHVVRVHDYVEVGVCALVMERLRGGTLADRLKLSEPRSCTRACALALAALHGLEHAHRRGILHRDVKPENLLFGERELLKVADFGLAKVVGARGMRLTATAQTLGTPAYMAPEQVSRSAGPLSAATDVWALGAVLFEMLSGERPFAGGGEVGDVLLQRLTGDPRPLDALAPEVPTEVAEVVMRALARVPGDRYETAGAFAIALELAAERALGPDAIAATAIPINRSEPADDTKATTLAESARVDLLRPSPGTPTVPSRTRRLRLAALIGGAAAAAVSLALVLLLTGGSGAPATLLPGVPVGWPKTAALGWTDEVNGPAGVAMRHGALVSPTQVGQTITDWSSHAGRPLATFIVSAHRHGLLPYVYFYLLRSLGAPNKTVDANVSEIRQALVNPSLMRIYWQDVRGYLRSAGSTRLPVAIGVEQSVWALLEQQLGFSGENPQTVPALVGGSGLPQLRGIEDDLLGFVRAWAVLRARYAPKVLLGYELGDYGANVDIAKDLPPRPALIAAARQSAEWYLLVSPSTFDFAAFDVSYGEQGQNPNSQTNWTAAKKAALVDYLREWVRVANRPVVLESVPQGNTVSRAIDERPYHWSDSWVQWLIGADRFSGLRALRDVGVIGVDFGVASGPDETCPCDAAHDGVTNGARQGVPSTSADDDGGYLASRLAALNRAGGLALH
jgi:serine/threonine-protein kinase